MTVLRLIFVGIAVVLSGWLALILIFGNPYGSFSEQGGQLMDMIWGRISLLDLYAGFFIGIALVWYIEPVGWVRWVVTLTTPVLGNPVLAIWLVARLGWLKRLAEQKA